VASLLIAVLFFWNSLRTLGGDTDIPDEAPRVLESGPLEAMIARKKMLLLSLKDLDNERKLGKILPADFEDVSYRYREEVKSLMRQIDAAAEPYRGRAEEIATKHLAEQGVMPKDDQKATVEKEDVERATVRLDKKPDKMVDATDDDYDDQVDSKAITRPNAPPVPRKSSRPPPADDDMERAAARTTESPIITTQKSLDIAPATLERRSCPSCKASNEPDAKFCKECATPLKKAESASAMPDITKPQQIDGDTGPNTPKSAPPPAALAAMKEAADEESGDAATKTEGAADA